MGRARRRPVWRLLLALLLFAPPTLARQPPPPRRTGKRHGVRPHRPPRGRLLVETPSGPKTLTIEAFAPPQATATIRLTGVSHQPAARLFTLHDDRGRHFIASEARCAADGVAIRCQLALPPLYLKRGRVLGLTVHVDGQDIGAPVDNVAEKLQATARGAPGDGGVAAPPGWMIPRRDGGGGSEPEPEEDDREESGEGP